MGLVCMEGTGTATGRGQAGRWDRRSLRWLPGPGRSGGTVPGWPMFEGARLQLDRDQQARALQPAMIRRMLPASAVAMAMAMFAARLDATPSARTARDSPLGPGAVCEAMTPHHLAGTPPLMSSMACLRSTLPRSARSGTNLDPALPGTRQA
jgi:hypothetical protein